MPASEMTDLFDPAFSTRRAVLAYRMFDSDARLPCVGKAKNLKNRLASYFPQDRPGAEDRCPGGAHRPDRNHHHRQ